MTRWGVGIYFHLIDCGGFQPDFSEVVTPVCDKGGLGSGTGHNACFCAS